MPKVVLDLLLIYIYIYINSFLFRKMKKLKRETAKIFV